MMPTTLKDIFENMNVLSAGPALKRKTVSQRFGEHPSVFKSQGPDFYQIREYDIDRDSTHQILWSMSDHEVVYVREAIATKEVPCVIMADVSSSMTFGLNNNNKQRLLLEIAGSIGLTCAHEQNRVGLMGVADTIIIDEPPRLGIKHIYYLVQKLYDFWNHPIGKKSRKTNLLLGLEALSRRLRQRSCIIVISDFVEQENITQNPIIRNLQARHNLFFIILYDENEFTERRWFGSIRIQDPETLKIKRVPIRRFRRIHEDMRKRRADLQNQLQSFGIPSIELCYGEHIQKLGQFFLKGGST